MEKEPIAVDHSQIHTTYLYIFGTAGICLAGYIFMTIRYILNTGTLPWMDLITEAIILLALLALAMTRTTYELGRKDITVTSASLFRTRVLKIPYKVIDGVHYFKVEPIKSIAYKHTYRMYGNLDKRDIYAMVYNIPHTDHVSRILMKASPEFWDAFAALLPGRIRIPQEEVLRSAFRHISGADQKQEEK